MPWFAWFAWAYFMYASLFISILVVTDQPVAAMPDLGTLVFDHDGGRQVFAALMNRYHGPSQQLRVKAWDGDH